MSTLRVSAVAIVAIAIGIGIGLRMPRSKQVVEAEPVTAPVPVLPISKSIARRVPFEPPAATVMKEFNGVYYAPDPEPTPVQIHLAVKNSMKYIETEEGKAIWAILQTNGYRITQFRHVWGLTEQAHTMERLHADWTEKAPADPNSTQETAWQAGVRLHRTVADMNLKRFLHTTNQVMVDAILDIVPPSVDNPPDGNVSAWDNLLTEADLPQN